MVTERVHYETESWIEEVVVLRRRRSLSANVKVIIPTEACVPLICFVITLFSAVNAA